MAVQSCFQSRGRRNANFPLDQEANTRTNKITAQRRSAVQRRATGNKSSQVKSTRHNNKPGKIPITATPTQETKNKTSKKMSTDANMTTAIIIRDEEELEGALLPVATHIRIEEEPSSVPAVPITHFEYETALAAEVQQQEQVAYTIPQNSKDTVSDDSRSRVKLAQRTGVISAEEERDLIRKANRKVFSHDYHQQEAVRVANQIAKKIDRKGQANLTNLVRNRNQVEIPPPPQQAKEEEELAHEESHPKSQGYKVGGYQMNDYQFGTTDYDTNDYQTSEYKSVYD